MGAASPTAPLPTTVAALRAGSTPPPMASSAHAALGGPGAAAGGGGAGSAGSDGGGSGSGKWRSWRSGSAHGGSGRALPALASTSPNSPVLTTPLPNPAARIPYILKSVNPSIPPSNIDFFVDQLLEVLNSCFLCLALSHSILHS